MSGTVLVDAPACASVCRGATGTLFRVHAHDVRNQGRTVNPDTKSNLVHSPNFSRIATLELLPLSLLSQH
jgi:hypothetical protein